MAGKSIIDVLENIPREVIYTIVLIAMILPLLRPLGLPVPVSEPIKKWYDAIESLPPGSLVLISHCNLGAYPAFDSMQVATLHHLFSRPVKLVFFSIDATGLVVYDTLLSKVDPKAYGKVYGVDYFHIGYIPGGETAMKALAEDFKAAVPSDYKGTPIDQIPMAKDIKDIRDFTMIICFTSAGETSIGWIRQWIVVRPEIKYLCCVLDMMLPTMRPYYEAGQVAALTGSAPGGEYEFLIGKPGSGIKKADAFTGAQLILLVFIIIGNIASIAKRMGKGGVR
ncbi:MAG: hypothetical protein NDF57_02940 [archaeon GBS-70-058]|nr:hypothetical protein [Candidatus Culexarchaeum nevadense]